MTYGLSFDVKKIKAPVKVVGDGIEMAFASGAELYNYKFESPYLVESLTAENSTIVLTLAGRSPMQDLSWAERKVSIFDGD